MCKEPTVAVSRALDTARASWALTHDAQHPGPLPAGAAATMARAAAEAAMQLEGVLVDFGHRLIPELVQLIRQGMAAMKTLDELGLRIADAQPGGDGSLHLTYAAGCTAEKAIGVLSRAENCLMVAMSR